jgi:hypothetical protein
MQARLSTIKEAHTRHQIQLAELGIQTETEKASRPESVWFPLCLIIEDFLHSSMGLLQEQRTGGLQKLARTKQELGELERALSAYGSCDPAKVDEQRRSVMLAKEAAIRWTGKHYIKMVICTADHAESPDNFSMLLSHFTRTTGTEPSELRKFLDVEDEYEDIC